MQPLISIEDFPQKIKELREDNDASYKLSRRKNKKGEVHYYSVAEKENVPWYGPTFRYPFKVAVEQKFPGQVYVTSGGGSSFTFRVLTPEQKQSGQYDGYFHGL